MNVIVVRAKVKPECVTELEASIERMFDALKQKQPQGIRYASFRLADGVSYLAVLELDEGVENPLPAIPEFQAFQEGLEGWVSEPPVFEPVGVVGAYR